ncbi:MAG: helix-turn-helix transcriptional regulator [Clostridia bacterium]|nr:helix-turn-helix transcriptional regulator [Clostridia bacterium]
MAYKGHRIKELRIDRDLRQIDVAEKTGIDQRTLSNYETGKTNPDSYAIIKLSEFYDVSCDYLLGVTDYNVKDNKQLAEELKRIGARIDALEKYISKKQETL